MDKKKKAPVAMKAVFFLEDWRNTKKGEIVEYGIRTVEKLVETKVARLATAEDKARVKKEQATIEDKGISAKDLHIA